MHLCAWALCVLSQTAVCLHLILSVCLLPLPCSLQSVPECSAPIVPVAPVEREAAKEKRNRALEFAKQVPRPKVSSARTSSQPPKGGEPRPHSSDGGLPGGYDEGSTLRMSAVEELEAKHLHMRAQVDAIRREYGV